MLQVITAGLMRKLQALPQVTGTGDGSMDSHSARIFNIYVLVWFLAEKMVVFLVVQSFLFTAALAEIVLLFFSLNNVHYALWV